MAHKATSESSDINPDRLLVTLTVSEFRALVRNEVEVAMQTGKSYLKTDRLLSTAEAAKILNVSVMWLYKNSKRLPFSVRIGRSVKFSHKGLQRWMEAQSRA